MKKTLLILSVLGMAGLAMWGWAHAQEGEETAIVSAPSPTPTPLTAAELAVYEALDARPMYQFTNADLAQYLDLRTRHTAGQTPSISAAQAMGTYARRSLGQPFRLFAVRFEWAESDCVVFVERTLALSLATDWNSFYLISERLRHKDGVVGYKNRNFFTLGDWLPNNAWALRDISGEVGPPENRPAQSFTYLVCPKVFYERPSEVDPRFMRITFKGGDGNSPDKEVRTGLYVPSSRIPEVLSDLRTGDVVLVLRPSRKKDGHLDCDHLGLICVEPDRQVNMVHAAPPGVRQEPLTGFLQRCSWVSGLKFLRLKDNARQLAAQEVSRMAASVTVTSAVEQDTKVQTMRANRLAAQAAGR